MDYIEWLKGRGKQNREKLIEKIIKSSRFPIETDHQKRLYTALRWTNQKEIFETTLLAPKIHTKHCIQLRNKLLKKWTAIRNKARSKLLERIQIAEGLTKKLKGVGKFERQIVSDSDIANEHLRFFTLIDSVVPLDSFEAIIPIIKMKEEIIEAVNKTKGINCIGAIEIEVVPINKWNYILKEEIRLNKINKEIFLKLNCLNRLAEHNNLTEYCSKDDASLFLIHFHGIVFAKQESQFKNFEEQLKKNTRWNLAQRQIQLKKLSSQHRNKPKTVEQNLKDIAKYITKGGNDMKDGYVSFKYKLNSNNDDDLTTLYEDGVLEDAMSLTYFEISEQAKLINVLMELDKYRTGYLINV